MNVTLPARLLLLTRLADVRVVIVTPYLAQPGTQFHVDGFSAAAEAASYVVNRLDRQGSVVMFVFDRFPPIQARGVVADGIYADHADIEVLDRITPDVQDGGIANAFSDIARQRVPLDIGPLDGSDIPLLTVIAIGVHCTIRLGRSVRGPDGPSALRSACPSRHGLPSRPAVKGCNTRVPRCRRSSRRLQARP